MGFKYTIKVCDKEEHTIYENEWMTLIGLRLFCQDVLYPKLHNGEWDWSAILIEREEVNG